MILATLDTGALVAMERHKLRGMMLLRAAREQRARLVTITPVIAEWWHGRSDVRDRIKIAVTPVAFPVRAAEAAGLVLGQMRGEKGRAMSIDVMVMAFAAMYGGALLYTSDVTDMQRIGKYFPGVRVLGV